MIKLKDVLSLMGTEEWPYKSLVRKVAASLCLEAYEASEPKEKAAFDRLRDKYSVDHEFTISGDEAYALGTYKEDKRLIYLCSTSSGTEALCLSLIVLNEHPELWDKVDRLFADYMAKVSDISTEHGLIYKFEQFRECIMKYPDEKTGTLTYYPSTPLELECVPAIVEKYGSVSYKLMNKVMEMHPDTNYTQEQFVKLYGIFLRRLDGVERSWVQQEIIRNTTLEQFIRQMEALDDYMGKDRTKHICISRSEVSMDKDKAGTLPEVMYYETIPCGVPMLNLADVYQSLRRMCVNSTFVNMQVEYVSGRSGVLKLRGKEVIRQGELIVGMCNVCILVPIAENYLHEIKSDSDAASEIVDVEVVLNNCQLTKGIGVWNKNLFGRDRILVKGCCSIKVGEETQCIKQSVDDLELIGIGEFAELHLEAGKYSACIGVGALTQSFGRFAFDGKAFKHLYVKDLYLETINEAQGCAATVCVWGETDLPDIIATGTAYINSVQEYWKQIACRGSAWSVWTPYFDEFGFYDVSYDTFVPKEVQDEIDYIVGADSTEDEKIVFYLNHKRWFEGVDAK